MCWGVDKGMESKENDGLRSNGQRYLGLNIKVVLVRLVCIKSVLRFSRLTKLVFVLSYILKPIILSISSNGS